MDNLELLASIPFISFITAGLGAYLGSYLRTKGQNLATHEDIDKLVDQVRAVTTATKEIESKISEKAWDRQRRWELKREVLFDAGRKISATADALSSMYAVYLTNKGATGQVSPERHDKALKAYRQITDSFYALEGTAMVMQLVCTQQLSNRVRELNIFLGNISEAIAEGRLEKYEGSTREIAKRLHEAMSAMRLELWDSDVSPEPPLKTP